MVGLINKNKINNIKMLKMCMFRVRLGALSLNSGIYDEKIFDDIFIWYHTL